MRVACSIVLTHEERRTLEHWARGRSTPARRVLRAGIVLLAAGGQMNKAIGKELGTSQEAVSRWRNRFAQRRLGGLEKDAPRGGRPPTGRDKVARVIVERTLHTVPPNATHWSTRTMAKVRDVVGLYLNPPENALVLSADEKSQIQALDRTQPSLPIYPGRCGTMTHDYKRHGTTTLFAALEVVQGRLIGTCMPRHRHQEWLQFLRLIDRETPADLDLHLIVDNYQTHKHPKVVAWLKRHPRFHVHFIPTSSSWLNLIERWFRELTEKRVRRGVFKSVLQLVQALLDYMAHHNQNPRSFVWTAKADDILAKVQRARAVLDNQGSA